MSVDRRPTAIPESTASPSPDDDFLLASLFGGDAAALNKLMDRYDRLVRYTIFRASQDRCRQDPEWLDSLASTTWEGLVRSMRRRPGHLPRSLRAYLVQIARNQVATALRNRPCGVDTRNIDTLAEEASLTATLEEPIEVLSRLELLEVLRGCLVELDTADRTLASQLQAITDRRWREAAEALGLKESTLRSRWKRVLARLRTCLERKMGKTLAPGDADADF